MGRRDARGWRAAAIAFIIVAVAVNVTAWLFVTSERTVYFWDYRIYWHRTESAATSVAQLLGEPSPVAWTPSRGSGRPAAAASGPVAAVPANQPPLILRFLRSLWNDEYNVLPAIPLVAWSFVFGAERLAYVLGIVDIYGLAATAALLALIAATTHRRSPELLVPTLLALPAALLALPVLWAPPLRGMPDIGVLAINASILALYLRRQPTELSSWSLALIGMLLALAPLFRRWEAFWSLSFVIVVGFDVALDFLSARRFDLATLQRYARVPFTMGIPCLAIAITIGGPFFYKALTTDYGDLYAAWRSSEGIADRAAALVGWVGGGALLWTVLATVFLLVAAPTVRRPVLLLIAQAIVVWACFTHTQDMAPQHTYLLISGLSVVMALGLAAAIAKLGRGAGIVLASLALFLGVASSYAVFVPSGAAVTRWAGPLVPSERFPPLVRRDAAELDRLYARLDELLAAGGADARFYVLSFTPTLNGTEFKSQAVRPPFAFLSADRLLGTSVIDRVQGFPMGLLAADIVVLAEPLSQTRPEGSRVLFEPAASLRAGTDVGAAFGRLPDRFTLEDGVTVELYRRARTSTPAEIAAFSKRLRAFYPDRPYVWDPAKAAEAPRPQAAPLLNTQTRLSE